MTEYGIEMVNLFEFETATFLRCLRLEKPFELHLREKPAQMVAKYYIPMASKLVVPQTKLSTAVTY